MNWLDHKCMVTICKQYVHSHVIDSPAEPKRKLFERSKHQQISFRIFDEFVMLTRKMSKVMLSSDVSELMEKQSKSNIPNRIVYFPASPKGASVPSLGLSNKAVYDETQPPANGRHIKDEYPDNYFVAVSMDGMLK